MESRDENEPQPGPSTSASVEGASGGAEAEPRTLLEFLALPENKGCFAIPSSSLNGNALPKPPGANLVVPLSWCPHLDTCLAAEVPETIDPEAPCMECSNIGENWICLMVCDSLNVVGFLTLPALVYIRHEEDI